VDDGRAIILSGQESVVTNDLDPHAPERRFDLEVVGAQMMPRSSAEITEPDLPAR
jgi:hypothetical protein